MLRGFLQNHAGLNLPSCYKPVREADEADQRLSPFIPVLRKVSDWVHSPLGGCSGQNVGWRGGVQGGGLSGRMNAASISRQAVTAGEGSSRLGVLSGLPPLSLLDMLHGRTWHLILSYPCLSVANIFQILQYLTCKKDFIFTAMKPKRDARLQFFLCSLTGEHFHKDT